jgi:hypothetical protein
MKFTKAQQQIVLVMLVALIVLINGYSYLKGDNPKTAPLTFQRGAVANAPVRQGLQSRQAGGDPLSIFLLRRGEKFPGVARDIFRMENPAPKPSISHLPPPPPVHVKTPEEIAAEAAKALEDARKAAVDAAAASARADLSKFQFLGYLTEKDSTLFLSKDGELFIVKKGSAILKSYKVKDVSKNYVILQDTVTGVEVRLEIPSGELAQQQQPQSQEQPQAPLRRQRMRRPMLEPIPGASAGP